jgi:hypothetical protein
VPYVTVGVDKIVGVDTTVGLESTVALCATTGVRARGTEPVTEEEEITLAGRADDAISVADLGEVIIGAAI